MPADPTHPDQPDGEARFRADLLAYLLAYLDSLPVGELAGLLGELPSGRQEPLQLGVLMVALNERLTDAYKLLPPAGQPGPGEGRRRSLREVVQCASGLTVRCGRPAAIQVPDTRGRSAASIVARRLLRELVAGVAAAAGM